MERYLKRFLTWTAYIVLWGACLTAGTATAPGLLQPRQKDSYILISPGADRVYGTADDITNFGDVLP